MNEQAIYSIERPNRRLLTLFFIRSILTGPLFIFVYPFYYFRYKTLHYKFDRDGIQMRWGLLFRREVYLGYARIQDVHLAMGVIQRWLGLADIHIQTASGSSGPEMTIQGILKFEDLREFLYSRMHGVRDEAPKPSPPADWTPEAISLLQEIHRDLNAANEKLAAAKIDRSAS